MARYDPMPATPELISWARMRAGVSINDAVAKWASIAKWEAGDDSPSYPQLEAMADAFRVPVAVFFFPAPPDVPPVSESFRTIPDVEFDTLPSRIRLLVRKAKTFQINLDELTSGQNQSNRIITHDLTFSTETSVQVMAANVREYLGIPMNEQTSWLNDDEALKEWRGVLQSAGIAVFKDSFEEDRYSGFCLYDDRFPLIYINNNNSKARQIFTLFHELSHLLFHTSGIDGLSGSFVDRLSDKDRDVEVKCNRFASEFLVPSDVFEDAFRGMRATEEAAEELSDHFKVSRAFIYLRFLQRGLISQAVYEEAEQRWRSQKTKGAGGSYYNNIMTYRGREYIALAFQPYWQNRIDDVQLASYLDINPKSIAPLEQRLLEQTG